MVQAAGTVDTRFEYGASILHRALPSCSLYPVQTLQDASTYYNMARAAHNVSVRQRVDGGRGREREGEEREREREARVTIDLLW